MKRFIAFLCLFLLNISLSHAVLTINVVEDGANVVATSSGSLNLTGLTYNGRNFNGTESLGETTGGATDSIQFGTSSSRSYQLYSGFTASDNLITDSTHAFTGIASGDYVGIHSGFFGGVAVPDGYVSNADISGTATWLNKSFATLKLVAGSYVYPMGNGDSIVLNIGAATVDSTDPTLLSSTPADNATGVSLDPPTLSLVFDEPIFPQSGIITIHKTSDDSQVNSRSVTGSTGSGTPNISIGFEGALETNTEYYVLIPATAFDDEAGNSYAGISSTTELSFSTATPTTLVTNYTGTLPSGATGTLSFTSTDAACTFATPPQFLDTVSPAPPASIFLVDGVISFTVSGCTPGATVTLTMDYGAALPVGSNFWKAGTPWYRLPATVAGTTVTFSITDGGLGDADGLVNGTIVNPSGAVINAPAPPIVTGNGQSATPIPTMSVWGLGILIALMGFIGFNRRRKM